MIEETAKAVFKNVLNVSFFCVLIFLDKGVTVVTEKELKKLNRYQLLELIILQTEEMEKLKKELEETKAKLEKRQIIMEKVGNIAEASLQLSGIFEAAQMAADVYLESVKEYVGAAEEIVEHE